MINQFGEQGILDILKKFEPLANFFQRLDQSEVLALCFALSFLVLIASWWYWVLFKNGAEKWRDGIIAFNRRLGLKYEGRLASKLILFKIFITIILFVALTALYLAIVSLVK